MNHSRTLIAFIHLLAFEKDENARQRAIQIAAGTGDIASKAAAIQEIAKGHGAADALVTRQRLLFEMMLCRAVDNYLCYIAGLLTQIFTHRPEALRSAEKITVDEVLQHTDMQDVIKYIAEQKVLARIIQGPGQEGVPERVKW